MHRRSPRTTARKPCGFPASFALNRHASRHTLINPGNPRWLWPICVHRVFLRSCRNPPAGSKSKVAKDLPRTIMTGGRNCRMAAFAGMTAINPAPRSVSLLSLSRNVALHSTAALRCIVKDVEPIGVPDSYGRYPRSCPQTAASIASCAAGEARSTCDGAAARCTTR
jgi:hypothetical protein